MNLGTLTGAMNLPVVERLRAVHRKTRPGTRERVNAAVPVIAELEKSLDPVINGVGLGALLGIGRMVRKDLPSADKVRHQFGRCKLKLRNDGNFVRYVADALPGIAAKYSSSNIMDIVRDPQFIELLKRGAS
ncbi:TPA: hypothetical protein JZ953_002352 [Escherichia coli]|uniref:hypothetical protein n=1 Tax=Escherichia coli TaxID=562 RepID=UPI0038914AFA|nr:hypothetical protein [Escherichia coli]HAY4545211.1 hypothetical protein [Escherichia coli]